VPVRFATAFLATLLPCVALPARAADAPAWQTIQVPGPWESNAPAESLKALQPHREFTVEQLLAEPLVAQPTHLSFDERGRLWVAQYRQYPYPAGLKGSGFDWALGPRTGAPLLGAPASCRRVSVSKATRTAGWKPALQL